MRRDDIEDLLLLGSRVIALYGTGGICGEGIAIAYAAEPTFLIQRDDGSKFHWVASLCKRKPRPKGCFI